MPSIIAFMLLFHLLQPLESPHLRIDLVFVGSIHPIVEATALHEVRSIWSPYNVEIRVSTADAVADVAVPRLAVVISTQTERKLPLATLGAIRFREGVPEPTILMYANTIDALVAQVPMLRFERESLPVVRDTMVGRAFGRALAHEIGHYLLRSRQHASGGLMRASHRSPELIAPERDGFDLSAEEVAKISEVATLSHE